MLIDILIVYTNNERQPFEDAYAIVAFVFVFVSGNV